MTIKYIPEVPLPGTKTEETCQHDNLHFGSGDFYIFCHDCGHRWATINTMGAISPENSNLYRGAYDLNEPFRVKRTKVET